MNWMMNHMLFVALMPGMITALVMLGFMAWEDFFKDIVFPPHRPDASGYYPNGGFMPYPGCVYGESQIRLARACLFLGSRTPYHTTKS